MVFNTLFDAIQNSSRLKMKALWLWGLNLMKKIKRETTKREEKKNKKINEKIVRIKPLKA